MSDASESGSVWSSGESGYRPVEANLQNLCSFAAVELMRGGTAPREAGLEIMRRVAAHTVPRLRDKQGRPNFDLKFYLLGKDGRHAGVSMWGPMKFAVTDRDGTRLEDCAALYQKDASKG